LLVDGREDGPLVDGREVPEVQRPRSTPTCPHGSVGVEDDGAGELLVCGEADVLCDGTELIPDEDGVVAAGELPEAVLEVEG
jgi:hypothetical protein